jgi:hypothetical protein
MFNNHHLPKSIINEAANLLGSTNNDFELTPELSEIVVEAACDYVQCATLEDRKAIIEWHIEQVANINDLEPQMIANFERAVEYTVREGKAMDAMRGGMEAAKRAGKRVVRAVKGAAGTLGSAITGETDPKAGVYTGVAGQQLTRKLAKRLPMQTNSVDYSQLMDALAELNEQQFEAYVDNLSESEFVALEQILAESMHTKVEDMPSSGFQADKPEGEGDEEDKTPIELLGDKVVKNVKKAERKRDMRLASDEKARTAPKSSTAPARKPGSLRLPLARKQAAALLSREKQRPGGARGSRVRAIAQAVRNVKKQSN